jgi:hypothetical protein
MGKLDDQEKVARLANQTRVSDLKMEAKILAGACGFCGLAMNREGAYPPKIYNPTNIPPGEAMCKFCWENAETIWSEAQKKLLTELKNL